MTQQVLILAGVLISVVMIAYQDIRRRLVHIGSIVLLFISTLLYSLVIFHSGYTNIIANIVFIFLLGLVLQGYFYVKYRKRVKLVNRYIGMGDILVFFSLSTAYNVNNYILLMLFSCFAGLAYWLLYNYGFRQRMIRIPLAGLMVSLHCLAVLLCVFYSFNPISDQLLRL